MIATVCFLAAVPGWGTAEGQDPSPGPKKTSVRPPQAAIDRAIDRGAEHIRRRQGADGGWPVGVIGRAGPSDTGHSSLMLLTLLHADVDPDDASISRGFAFLLGRRAEFLRTYHCSMALMAIDALVEKKLARVRSSAAGAAWARDKPAFFRARIPAALRSLAAELARRLAAAQLEDGSWTYAVPAVGAGSTRVADGSSPSDSRIEVPSWGGDYSNSQYALLGLRSAAALGLRVEAAVWKRSLQGLLDRQEKKDGPVIPGFPVPAVTELPWGGSGRAGASTRLSRDFVPRGWGYTPSENKPKPYGSMTTAAVASLVICKSRLLTDSRLPKETRERTDRAIEDGCAWIVTNFNVLDNANYGANNRPYSRPAGKIDGYSMYAFERAGILTGVDFFGENDWYGIGARYLVDHQAADGSWSSELDYEPYVTVSTAFAVLFLKRATRPVIETDGH